MNDLVPKFKDCAHQASKSCNIGTWKLIRAFGLGDFTENKIGETDSAREIAIKALEFFCDEGPHQDKFRVGVLTVGLFLDQYHGGTPGKSLQDLRQVFTDLVAILTGGGCNRDQLNRWIDSNF
jgi:hypothetical protein